MRKTYCDFCMKELAVQKVKEHIGEDQYFPSSGTLSLDFQQGHHFRELNDVTINSDHLSLCKDCTKIVADFLKKNLYTNPSRRLQNHGKDST